MSLYEIDENIPAFSPEKLQQFGGAQKPPRNPEDFASQLLSKKDTDEDGFLSLGETKLSEERFNLADTDGDGLLSKQELTDRAAERMEELRAKRGESRGQTNMQMAGVDPSGQQQAAGGSGSSGGSSGDSQEYDQLDLNKDGTVSLDELMQAVENGQASFSDIFGAQGSLASSFGSSSSSSSSSSKSSASMAGVPQHMVNRAMQAYAAHMQEQP